MVHIKPNYIFKYLFLIITLISFLTNIQFYKKYKYEWESNDGPFENSKSSNHYDEYFKVEELINIFEEDKTENFDHQKLVRDFNEKLERYLENFDAISAGKILKNLLKNLDLKASYKTEHYARIKTSELEIEKFGETAAKALEKAQKEFLNSGGSDKELSSVTQGYLSTCNVDMMMTKV